MKIRQSTSGELGAVIDMGEALQYESRTYEPLLTFNREESLEHYKREISSDNALIIVAENDSGDLIGYQYSYVTKLEYLSAKNVECTLEALYVLPKFRNSGVGRELMQYAEDWAINKHRVDRIRANVYYGNASSERIHQKDGFVPYNVEYLKLVSSNE